MQHYKRNLLISGIIFNAISMQIEAGSPMWTFTPLSDTTQSIQRNTTTTVQYRVTNNSKNRSLIMFPIPGVVSTTTPGSCPNPFTLAKSASCVLNLQITGNDFTPNIFGGPKVCQLNSDGSPNLLLCYQPSLNNVLNISFTSSPLPPRFVYIANFGTGAPSEDTVSKCLIDPVTGILSDCIYDSGGFDRPNGIAVGNGFAYVSNAASFDVTSCEISPTTGELTSCFSASNFNNVSGITFNNNYVYVLNAFDSVVAKCTANPTNGSLSNCGNTGSGFDSPSFGAAIDNGHFYAPNFLPIGSIQRCDVDGISGSLTNCAPTGVFNFPAGFAINNGYAYISAFFSNTVSKCIVHPTTGTLSGCVPTAIGTSFNNPSSIGFSNGFVYIGNRGNSVVYQCLVNTVNGDITTCNSTGSGFNEPSGNIGFF